MRRFALLGLATLPLLGCSQAADLTGAVAGSAAALVSANPAVGYGVGIGVRAATSAGMRYVVRHRQRAAQDEVAAVIGSLSPGETRIWQINHTIPIGNERGEVRLVRELENALAPCREALFSIAEGSAPEAPRRWFLTTACRQREQGGERWKWAAAEPATERWGSLQ